MKLLNGSELADYVKERQARQVRALRQAKKILPKLAIIQTVDTPVVNTYMRLKKSYGEDILIDVDVYNIPQSDALGLIQQLNEDESVYGTIVQLPLADVSQTDELVNAVAREKDVDGLARETDFDPATPIAINWLLAGYNVNLKGSKLAVVGQGRLVGAPLANMWQKSGYDVTTFDDTSTNMASELPEYDVIVSAAGVPGLITSAMVKDGATVVDAGTASEGGKIVGDVADEVRERDDIKITPVKGGVGPLTVAALFENVIKAAMSRDAAKLS